MPGMDVFSSSAFTMQSLTQRLLDAPHVPSRLRQMALFESDGVFTTDFSVERQANTLRLVPVSARNGPATQNAKDSRTLTKLSTVRVAMEDSVTADEVQNVRAFGSESELETLQTEIDRRNERMGNSIDATEEYHRMGALKGQILDADGSTVLVDLFTTFGVSAQSELDSDLDNGSPANGALRKHCHAIQRLIRDELGGLPYQRIHVLSSSEYFDDLVSHSQVQDMFKATPQAYRLGEGLVGASIDFGGITFEEYRGNVSSVAFIAANKALAFPVGVPGLFISRYAPAEYWDTVNTRGLPRYAIMNPDGADPAYKRTLRVQSQMLHICTRPRVLIPLKRT